MRGMGNISWDSGVLVRLYVMVRLNSVGGPRPYGTEQLLQYWGPDEEHFRCGAVVVRRIAGIWQFVLSGREEGLGCCSKQSLLSGNSIGKMVGGLFVLYVVVRAGLILRLTCICVPWQLLWCSWVDISVFPIDEP